MQPRKFRILSAITAGSLALAVAAITASSGTSQPATHTALAAQTESGTPVNLDACPTLHTGYPAGGCVAQLQIDLNIIQGNHLAVDGIFGSADSQTYKAVIAFQQAHNLPQDGIVGPDTKQALEAAISGDSVPTPTVPPATAPAPSTPAIPKTSIYGGTPIDVRSETDQATDGGCTAGYAAKRVSTGALYMVTANHCRNVLNEFGVSVGSANPVNIYPAGNRTVPYATDVDCSGADGGCLRATMKPTDMFAWFPDTAVPTAQVLVGSQLQNVTAEASYEDLRHNSQSVCWTGRGSRTEKCATVLGRWSELSIKQKLSVIRDGGQDIPFQFGTGYVILKGQAPVRGDSGSLVYLKMANGVEAVGMVIAAGHSDLSMMIPVQVIDANLGVVTLTTQ
jgi:peptidoglycan hydrolase-like protein with peptidoglycan-binding domain